MNLNQTAQLRHDSSAAANETQQRDHSRSNSINNDRQTPNANTIVNPSIGRVAYPAGRPIITAHQTQAIGIDAARYSKMNPRDRSLIPPLGFTHVNAPTNPDLTALHQAHLRSPRLVSTYPSLPDDPVLRYYQAVKTFALNPTKIPSNGPLSKYEFSISEEDFSHIPVDIISNHGNLATRAFTRGSLQYRLRCIHLSKVEAVGSISAWAIRDTQWPEGAALQLNRIQLEIRRKNLHGKDLPIDITQYVRLAGPASTNRISLSVTRGGRHKLRDFNYFIAFEVIEILKHNQIMDMCQQRKIPAEETLNSIKKSLANPAADDDDFAMIVSDLSIDLADPFTARIFEIPARGSSCLHRECFDLETFLQTRTSKAKRPQQPCMIDVWKCPLCGEDARPYSLQIDEFMVSVRSRLAEDHKLECKAIWISADGNWRPKNMKRARSPSLDSDADSDGEMLPRTNGATPNAAKPKTTVEVIELDD